MKGFTWDSWGKFPSTHRFPFDSTFGVSFSHWGSCSLSARHQRFKLPLCSKAKGSCGFHNGGWALEKKNYLEKDTGVLYYVCVLTLSMHMCDSLSAWTKCLQILVTGVCLHFGYFWKMERGERLAQILMSPDWRVFTQVHHSCPNLLFSLPPLPFCYPTGINIYAGMWHILDGNTSGCSLFSIHSCHAASYQGAMGLLHLVSTPTPNPF